MFLLHYFAILIILFASSEAFRIVPGRVLRTVSGQALMMSEEAPKTENKKGKPAQKDLSGFSVGQILEGKVLSVKAFGAFVEVPGGANVLLPRSVISRGAYAKLTNLATEKSKDLVKLEIVSVNQQNQTLSGKYIPSGVPDLLNIADLESKGADGYTGTSFNATVVGVHDFGVFAELDAYGSEGLIPVSRLPDGESPSSFAVGSTITVQIEELNLAKKKMTLTMKFAGASSGSGGRDSLASVPANKWLQGVVTSVSSFGLFVRPAGQDAVGLVHSSRVPAGLIKVLKGLAPAPAPGANKTDVEHLFSVGDVVKVRLQSYSAATKKLELAMTPARASEDEEDDYVVEGRDPEGEENTPVVNTDDDEEKYDPEDTLLWWQGKPYAKASSAEEAAVVDEEGAILTESDDVIEGTWRRLFEVDMREDASDFESKIQEAELKELEEEIGELSGLDDDLVDSLGFGEPSYNTKIFGSAVPFANIPEAWRKELSYFNDAEAVKTDRVSRLKGGKKAEHEEFEKLLREVEAELESVSARRSSRGPRQDEGAFDPPSASISAAPVAADSSVAASE